MLIDEKFSNETAYSPSLFIDRPCYKLIGSNSCVKCNTCTQHEPQSLIISKILESGTPEQLFRGSTECITQCINQFSLNFMMFWIFLAILQEGR